MSHKEAVIYDLEFTTWPGAHERSWTEKDEYREIIRIGAISIDLDSLQEVEALDIYVKPSVNPILSDYCARLTDITNEQIQAEGIALHEALHKFVGFVGEKKLFSYGDDVTVILENLWLNNITFNAKTLQSGCPIIIIDYNQTDSCFESNVVEVILYGPDHRDSLGKISEGVCVETNLNGNFVQLTNNNLWYWFCVNVPDMKKTSSGEITKVLGVGELNGNIHDPLFDARSILMGVRELVLFRHIENPLK